MQTGSLYMAFEMSNADIDPLLKVSPRLPPTANGQPD